MSLEVKKYKTWNDFWGKFLHVDFHLENSERWPSRAKKADWIVRHTSLPAQAQILDLGCGDGLLDICLSHMGHLVTAIDNDLLVIENAKNEDDTKNVKFQCNDLKNVSIVENKFDLIIFIQTLGLMNQKDDFNLLNKIFKGLKQQGSLILDIPLEVEKQNSWSKEFSTGVVYCESSFDENTRLQRINYKFTPHNEEPFGLLNPHLQSEKNEPGLFRYIYSKDELSKMLMDSGFSTEEIPHYYEKGYVALKGFK